MNVNNLNTIERMLFHPDSFAEKTKLPKSALIALDVLFGVATLGLVHLGAIIGVGIKRRFSVGSGKENATEKKMQGMKPPLLEARQTMDRNPMRKTIIKKDLPQELCSISDDQDKAFELYKAMPKNWSTIDKTRVQHNDLQEAIIKLDQKLKIAGENTKFSNLPNFKYLQENQKTLRTGFYSLGS